MSNNDNVNMPSSGDGTWENSSTEDYSVEDALELIHALFKPLVELTDIVLDNLAVLKDHRVEVAKPDIIAEDLRKLLHVPVVHLMETQLPHPATVCAASKCSEVYTVNGIKKYHYKQRCHPRCRLRGIPKDTTGVDGLIACYAMGGTPNCTVCNCGYMDHMHVYYEIKTMLTYIDDKSQQTQLNTHDDVIKAQNEAIRDLQNRVQQYLEEHKAITTALAKFAHFLQDYSSSPIKDAYEEYLIILIRREKSAIPSDQELIRRYETLLKEHAEHKAKLTVSQVSAKDVFAIVVHLLRLPLIGKKIDTLYNWTMDLAGIDEQIKTRLTFRIRQPPTSSCLVCQILKGQRSAQ